MRLFLLFPKGSQGPTGVRGEKGHVGDGVSIFAFEEGKHGPKLCGVITKVVRALSDRYLPYLCLFVAILNFN